MSTTSPVVPEGIVKRRSERKFTDMYPPILYTSHVIPSFVGGNGTNGPTP